ncbi:hypothetical protein V1523DRAFT_405755 [Lipomyces doorenjongii]
MATTDYNFGVEIETVVKPYGGRETYNEVDWHRQLTAKLATRSKSITYGFGARLCGDQA